MKEFLRIELPVVQQFSDQELQVEGFATYHDLILVHFKNSPVVARLDQKLQLQRKMDIGLHSTGYVTPRLSIATDGKLFAATQINTISIFNFEGQVQFTYRHNGWNSFLGSNCFFTGDGKYVLFITPGVNNDVLSVLDLARYELKTNIQLDGNQEYNYTFTATPHQECVFLEAAAGQDDCRLYNIHILHNEVSVEEIHACTDRVMGYFAPNGMEFVTAPHYDEGIEIYSFPTIEKVWEISQEKIFEGREEYISEDPDLLDYQVLYLNNKVLAAKTRFGRLLLINRNTQDCFGDICPEGFDLIAYDEDGEPTTEPDHTIEYGNDLTELRLLDMNRLLILDSFGHLKLYQLPNL